MVKGRAKNIPIAPKIQPQIIIEVKTIKVDNSKSFPIILESRKFPTNMFIVT